MFVYFCLIDMQIGGLGRISADRLQLWPDETFQQHYLHSASPTKMVTKRTWQKQV